MQQNYWQLGFAVSLSIGNGGTLQHSRTLYLGLWHTVRTRKGLKKGVVHLRNSPTWTIVCNVALHDMSISLMNVVRKKCRRKEKQKNSSTSFCSAYQSKVRHYCISAWFVERVYDCLLHFPEEILFVYLYSFNSCRFFTVFDFLTSQI